MRGDLGGGTGVNGRDTSSSTWRRVASLAFADVATFSLDLRFSAWTDQFCPSGRSAATASRRLILRLTGTGDTTQPMQFDGSDPGGKRFSGQRFYVGLTVVAAIDRLTSVFLQFEFLPGAGRVSPASRGRRTRTSTTAPCSSNDPLYYGIGRHQLKF